MRHLLNTLFVTSEDIYLSLDGENVVANRDKQEVARYPLHTLSGIVTFSYAGASPALMGACAQRDVSLAFCTPRGRFLARVTGESSGNVLLRRAQYRAADDPGPCCRIARSMIFGKVYNARWSLERTRRDRGLRLDAAALSAELPLQADRLIRQPALIRIFSLQGIKGIQHAHRKGAGGAEAASCGKVRVIGQAQLMHVHHLHGVADGRMLDVRPVAHPFDL